jgi:nifR3 family TIM-barrel protein
MRLAGIELAAPVVAAPMAGVSNPAFRLMARRFGAAMVYTEMVSAAGLVRDRARTWELTRVLPQERPVGLQLFGGDPETMHRAARLVSRLPIDLIDINLGCPVRRVRRQGAGAALLLDPPRAAEVVAAVREATSLPVTVKVRLGWAGDELERLLPPVLEAGAEVVCLHARSVKQGFAGRADWDAIARLVSWCPVPVIGNGDVRSGRDAKAMLETTGCAAVMIGRGAMGNPWVFGRAAARIQGREPEPVSLEERRRALWEHMELARATGGEGLALHFARQFMMWYSKGLPGSAAYRRLAGRCRDLERLVALTEEYFDHLARQEREAAA